MRIQREIHLKKLASNELLFVTANYHRNDVYDGEKDQNELEFFRTLFTFNIMIDLRNQRQSKERKKEGVERKEVDKGCKQNPIYA